MDKRITLKIDKITEETETVRTFTFLHDLKAEPGQFIMLNCFKGGEKPFSIADCTADGFSITVKRVGDFTKDLFNLIKGDIVGIRGAYGSSFFISGGCVLLSGGGYGIPPLYFLAKRLLKAGAEVTVVNGARSREDLIFSSRFKELDVNYNMITEEECSGTEGTAVDLTGKLFEKTDFNYIYASGPELMLKSLQYILADYEYQFLFERYMKCAIGICGSCTMDPTGIRLCVEGPVLGKSQIEHLTDFGKYKRDAAGRKVFYKENHK